MASPMQIREGLQSIVRKIEDGNVQDLRPDPFDDVDEHGFPKNPPAETEWGYGFDPGVHYGHLGGDQA